MTSARNFHEGEVALQTESGVDTAAFDAMVERAFHPELSDTEVGFVNTRTFSVAATLDAGGRPWASPVFGVAGELFAVIDRTTVRVKATAVDGDPLLGGVRDTGRLGVLYFDPSRRRRAKSLGRAEIDDDGSLIYRMDRNFGLCNKYIFKRRHEPDTTDGVATGQGEQRRSLDQVDVDHLRRTDTVFLASFHVGHGIDPTHRGGPAGFVDVIDETTVALPDYVGNGMFQTLGNLLIDDRIGMTSTDFATGRTLHMTGRGTVSASPAADPYSERTLKVRIEEVRVSHPAAGEWTDLEPFELRPGLVNPATPYLPPS